MKHIKTLLLLLTCHACWSVEITAGRISLSFPDEIFLPVASAAKLDHAILTNKQTNIMLGIASQNRDISAGMATVFAEYDIDSPTEYWALIINDFTMDYDVKKEDVKQTSSLIDGIFIRTAEFTYRINEGGEGGEETEEAEDTSAAGIKQEGGDTNEGQNWHLLLFFAHIPDQQPAFCMEVAWQIDDKSINEEVSRFFESAKTSVKVKTE